MTELGIGIIGLGVVGGGVYETLMESGPLVESRAGVKLAVRKVADVDDSRCAELGIDPKLFTNSAEEVISDPAVDVVVELIGGYSPAQEIILGALKNGKSVVTANKALLARSCLELAKAAEDNQVELRFEASVCGGIPIVKVLREGLVANSIEYVFGIVNGTANYILSQMTYQGMSFKKALKDAQAKGFAEADPSVDIEGHDSAHKLAILASLAFYTPVNQSDIFVQGISGITSQDVGYAEELGYVIKLLAIAKDVDGELDLRVHPTLISDTELLASVRDEYNAVYLKGDVVGTTMYYGKGAGRYPTTSAVLSDIVDIVRSVTGTSPAARRPFAWSNPRRVRDILDALSCYYIRFSALDHPGVLGRISTILGGHDISIASVIQKAREAGRVVPVVMMTHLARERDMRNALAEIDGLDCIKGKSTVVRVESL